MKNSLLDNIDIRPLVGGVLLFVQGLSELINDCQDFAELEEEVQKLPIREYVPRFLPGCSKR